ncbi:MBL fold metallo-hydrolase [Reichenbachiella versicolor]|uniref:MBL fold metallo-hydrolase n=1 Tax=Reichenbachiella versicolor TaxID=1821036 RepID=UPI001C8700C5|nr:MBL fold metallo-hydrolase [Reichenbachiella versicolor]
MNAQGQDFRTIDAGKLKLEVFNASENSFGVASVIVSGKTEAILIDAQFTLADAEVVATRIKESGKKLTNIYISHGDPDFYFGLEVFKKYFPKVTVYATPATIDHIKATAQKKLDVWGGRLGDALTSNAILPQVIKDNFFEVDGEKLEIVGLEEYPSRTFVWIPSIKAAIGGINVFGNTFNLWMADSQTTESRDNWISILNSISDLNPKIVVPAHAASTAAFDMTSVNHTKTYIEFYEEALKTNKTSVDLVKAIKAKYPDLTFEVGLQLSAKVTTGEMKW